MEAGVFDEKWQMEPIWRDKSDGCLLLKTKRKYIIYSFYQSDWNYINNLNSWSGMSRINTEVSQLYLNSSNSIF